MPPNFTGESITSFLGGAFRIEVNFDEVTGLVKTEAIDAQTKGFLSSATLGIAERVRDIAKERVSPDGKEKVGATGAASRNIFAKPDGNLGALVFEGPYIGNAFIRTGRRESSAPPPIQPIVDWLAAKRGIKWEVPAGQDKWRITKAGGPRARGGQGYEPRPFKRDLKVLAGMISKKIAKSGVEHFKDLYPSSSPGYDYYGEIFSRTPGVGAFSQALKTGYNRFFVLFGRYVKSGKPATMKPKEFIVRDR